MDGPAKPQKEDPIQAIIREIKAIKYKSPSITLEEMMESFVSHIKPGRGLIGTPEQEAVYREEQRKLKEAQALIPVIKEEETPDGHLRVNGKLYMVDDYFGEQWAELIVRQFTFK